MPHVIARGNGATNVTSEKINWQSTLAGALAFMGAQIGLRLVALAVLVFLVLLVGRAAGPLLGVAVAYEVLNIEVRRLWPPELAVKGRLLKKRRRTHILVLLGLAVALSAAAVFKLWPALWWEVAAGRLWVMHARGSFSLGPLWLWARVLLIVGLPWAMTRPFINFDWVMDIETRWPKARETGFGTADIESAAVRDPHRRKIRRQPRPASIVMPGALTVEGDMQQPNEPDTSAAMKMGGV